MRGHALTVVLAGSFTVLIANSIRYGYPMLLPEMLPALGISKVQAGSIFTFYLTTYTLFSAILGILTDHFKYRLILGLFTGLMGAGSFMMGAANNFVQACLAFSITGIGHAACWVPVIGLVQKKVPDNRRGMALSLVSMGIGIGLILWGILLPIIVNDADWRAGWRALGYSAIAIAILNLILIKDPENHKHKKTGMPSHLGTFLCSIRNLLQNRTFWIIAIAYMLIGFNVLVPFTFISIYARESLKLSYSESTSFIPTIAFMGIIGQLVLGPLSDRIDRTKMVIFCTTLMAFGCFGMAFSRSAILLYVMSGLYGLGYGAVWLMYAAVAYDFFPIDTTGTVVGLWTLFYGIGSITSPTICGMVIDITNNYSLIFIIGFVAGIISCLVLFAMPKRRILIS